MNKQQKKRKDGTIGRGIEWTDYTHNPIKGCMHGCEWEMPDGTVANCYAEDVATNVAQSAYPQGFEHHYWEPEILDKPLRVKTPSKIFVGSMADVFGHWVPPEQIQAVLEMCRRAHWHTFQLLTKNPVRVQHFDIPPNVWIGASTPPTFMWKKRLSDDQQRRWMERTLESLVKVKASVKWISAEPLSFDMSELFEAFHDVIQWIVIGAASNGMKYFPPRESDVKALLEVADRHGIKIFYKGNMSSLGDFTTQHWREEFPTPRYAAPNPTLAITVPPFKVDDRVISLVDGRRLPGQLLNLPAAYFHVRFGSAGKVREIAEKGIAVEFENDLGNWVYMKPNELHSALAAPCNRRDNPYYRLSLQPYTAYDKPLPDYDMPWEAYTPPAPVSPPTPEPTFAIGDTVHNKTFKISAKVLEIKPDGWFVGRSVDNNGTVYWKEADCEKTKIVDLGNIPGSEAERVHNRLINEGFKATSITPVEPPAPAPKTRLANFRDVKEHWDPETKRWDDPKYLYIGRENAHYGLPASPWGNPIRIDKDTSENRKDAIARFRLILKSKLEGGVLNLEDLRGKLLICWCYPQHCHGDVLLELLEEKRDDQPKQLALFDMPTKRRFD